MKKRLLTFSLITLLFVTCSAWAIQSPISLLQSISNQMITKLERNKSRLKQPSVVDSIVRSSLLPYVDLNRMSAMVVGRYHWMKATPAQKSSFKNEFTRMVIATYSAAISSYNGDVVRFYPLRGGYSRQTVQVKSVIIRRNGQRIPVTYQLIRRGGSWRVYDFSVENVSIVSSYRAQFAGVLSNRGMGGLIARLQRHNRKR